MENRYRYKDDVVNMTEETWKNQEDVLDTRYHNIEHLEPQKRLRVWATQQMNDVLEALSPSNYLTEFVRFLKGCDNLSRCFPNHESLGHVNVIRIDFWVRYQYKVKTQIKPLIKKFHRMEINKDLNRMGFL